MHKALCSRNIFFEIRIKTLLLWVILLSGLYGNSQEYNAELIFQRTEINLENNHLTKTEYFEIKINNRAGEEYTHITIPYSKLNRLNKIEAHIKDSNGKVVKELKKSEITERSSISYFSFYEDEFIKEFTLKHNSYPYTIIYSCQIQQNEFIFIDNWTPVINEKVPTRQAYLNLSVPNNYKIAFTNQFVDQPEIDTTGNFINYKWQASYSKIIKREEFSPHPSGLFPNVAVVPLKFDFEIKGSFQDWSSYGNWQYNLIKNLNDLPDEEKTKILALTRNCASDREKIKTLYHYLQDETRYINISIETGGLKPYPASYVSRNKFGDCKALTNYFKSMLEILEIDAFYTNVYGGNPSKEIKKDFPAQQFNHIILYIPLSDEEIWLDCTSDMAFNYLGTFTQNRDVLIIDENNSRFMKTPALNSSDNYQKRNINVGYQSQEAILKFTNTYKGYMYEYLCQLENNFSETTKSKQIRNYVLENGYQLIDYQISEENRDSAKIVLCYNASTNVIYRHYGNDILIKNIPFILPHFENPDERKLSVQIDYPTLMIDTLTYEIPDGYKLSVSNPGSNILNRFGQYKFDINEKNNKIIVVKKLLINAGSYPVSDFKDFYEFYDQITQLENITRLTLNK